MFFADILDAKIIDDEAEGDGEGLVPKQAWSVGGLGVACLCEMDEELIIGQTPGLGKSVHAFADLDIEETIVDQGSEIVLFHDGVWDVLDWDVHVLFALHWSIEIEVFNVRCHKLGAWGGEDAVEEALGCGNIGGLRADIAWVVDFVATDSETDSLGVGFVGLVGGYDL